MVYDELKHFSEHILASFPLPDFWDCCPSCNQLLAPYVICELVAVFRYQQVVSEPGLFVPADN